MFDQLFLLFKQQATLQAKDSNISPWLTVIPLARSQLRTYFDVSVQELKDGLALWYS